MAPIKNNLPPLFFFLLLFLLPRSATAIPEHSIDTLLHNLRTSGHELFANSISTSDLLFDLLSLSSLTLLAPPDPSLFALGMTHSSPSYLSSLRLHVIPNSSSSSSSLDLSSTTFLPTLLPARGLHLSRDGSSTFLDGVRVILPKLYRSNDSSVSVYRLMSALPSLPVPLPGPVLPPVGTMYPSLAPVGTMYRSLAPVDSLWRVAESPEASNIAAVKRGLKRGKCGALDAERMMCSLKSLSEVDDVEEEGVDLDRDHDYVVSHIYPFTK